MLSSCHRVSALQMSPTVLLKQGHFLANYLNTIILNLIVVEGIFAEVYLSKVY